MGRGHNSNIIYSRTINNEVSNPPLYVKVSGSGTNPSEVSWDDKWALTYLVMYDITGKVARQMPR